MWVVIVILQIFFMCLLKVTLLPETLYILLTALSFKTGRI